LRIVFFGSPDFALPSLDQLSGAGHEVALVVSQPARPVGRRGLLSDPPVAAYAKRFGRKCYQPESLKGGEAQGFLTGAGADLFVVVAYGRILGPKTLSIPRLGAVNVHGSILPRWRGASPVQAALLAGDTETGVSIMRMDPGMDTGPVYAEARTPILESDDAESLSARLAAMGGELLVKTIAGISWGTSLPVPQAKTGVTECPKIRRDDGRVEWTLDAAVLVRRERAFTPWPGLFAFRRDIRTKLSGLSVVETSGRPGEVMEAGDRLVVACSRAGVSVRALQTEGRRLLSAREFVNGEHVAPGEVWS
jgi:methionyl-tRNA formyltransferase